MDRYVDMSLGLLGVGLTRIQRVRVSSKEFLQHDTVELKGWLGMGREDL